LAPEVLQLHFYSKRSDVFMLATTFWEIFHARQICHEDPAAERYPACLVPFPEFKQADVSSVALVSSSLQKILLVTILI
jgi:hypothetical protein